MEKTSTSTTSERAQQLLNKNIELDEKRQKSLQAKIPSDPNTWHQKRENYEAIILEDHAFSEQHKIEFTLWQLHYKRIEEFRAHFSAAQAAARSSAIKSSRAPLRPDRITKIRVQFKAFLAEATGFYHDLILKIRAKYGLSLGNFSDDSDNLTVMGNDVEKSSDVKKAIVSCHRCLIYLGDLARYKGLYGEGESRAHEYTAASSYYLQAASLWPSNGNPHHQLALLATYSGDELVTVYRYFRSLAVGVPIPTAKDNLVTAFEKNHQSYTQQLEMRKITGNREFSMKEKYKDFCNKFVRLHGVLFSQTSLETFSTVLSSVTEVLHELLASGPEEKQNFGRDSMENGLAILRLTATLIFTVYNVNKKNEGQTDAEILQDNVLFENACNVTFDLMGLIVERCLELHDPSSSFLLPSILVFLEWLACFPNVAACSIDEKKSTATKMSFWKHCIALLNKLVFSRVVSVDEEGETDSRLAMWEDFELRGFLPLLPAQSILEFCKKHSPGVGGSNKERRTRVKRIIAAGKALSSIAMVDQKTVSFDTNVKQFIIGNQPQMPENSLQSSYFTPFESPTTEQETAIPSVNSLMMQENVYPAFEGEDEDEEIVFKPVVVEKQMNVMGLTRNSSEVPEKGKTTTPLTSIPLQVHPVKNLNNSTRLTKQQTSLVDGIKKMKFVENGILGVQNAGQLFPPLPSVSLMDTAMYSDHRRASEGYMPSNMNSVESPEVVADNIVVKLPTISASFKSQGGRPVRHLGPPPGFSHVPPKSVNMPVPSVVRTNGSMIVDDYSWSDGFHPSSASSLGPSYSTNQLSLGITPVVSNSGSSNGYSGLPFAGRQSSVVQLQQGSLKSYSEYQSFRNMHPSHGQKILEQQDNIARHQFSTQTENYQVRPTWTAHYRV